MVRIGVGRLIGMVQKQSVCIKIPSMCSFWAKIFNILSIRVSLQKGQENISTTTSLYLSHQLRLCGWMASLSHIIPTRLYIA